MGGRTLFPPGTCSCGTYLSVHLAWKFEVDVPVWSNPVQSNSVQSSSPPFYPNFVIGLQQFSFLDSHSLPFGHPSIQHQSKLAHRRLWLQTTAYEYSLLRTPYLQSIAGSTCHRLRVLCGNIAPRLSAAHVPLSHALLRALWKPGPGPLLITHLPTTFPVPLRRGSKHAFLGFNVYCIPAPPPAHTDTYLLNPGMEPLNDNRVPFQPSFVLVAFRAGRTTAIASQFFAVSCVRSQLYCNAKLSILAIIAIHTRTYKLQTPPVKDQTPLACDKTPGQDAKQVTPRFIPSCGPGLIACPNHPSDDVPLSTASGGAFLLAIQQPAMLDPLPFSLPAAFSWQEQTNRLNGHAPCHSTTVSDE
ncbi:uncharacterized protein CLUP02_03816 [Colletotrichum lupini]|uniref:Uncharacterized protein n=1 Tax=Colletotrichum lupini TaxID=145971 RepID=A0A9Q8WCI5_9PEZI|nr:uncharacterized protein CLUP02_03816 [Colletotrichum lupini]UQC78339.1 hypothetical protein CLUP02_03816 [Colletotrichum lupini]